MCPHHAEHGLSSYKWPSTQARILWSTQELPAQHCPDQEPLCPSASYKQASCRPMFSLISLVLLIEAELGGPWFQTQLVENLTCWINIKSPSRHHFGQKILQPGYLYQRQAAQNMAWVLWCCSLPVLIVREVSLGLSLYLCCDWLWGN